jgi:hypothetical protein
MHRRWRDTPPALDSGGMFPAAASDDADAETGDD